MQFLIVFFLITKKDHVFNSYFVLLSTPDEYYLLNFYERKKLIISCPDVICKGPMRVSFDEKKTVQKNIPFHESIMYVLFCFARDSEYMII